MSNNNSHAGDGLSIITNDKVYFYVDVDEVPCHAWRTALVFAEGFLGWTLVLFNFERYVALQWPFFTRRFIKPRRVAIALIVLFGINILIGLLAIPVFKVISLKVCQSVTKFYNRNIIKKNLNI